MSKPSSEELASLIDRASRLLAKNRSSRATLEQITALHQELNVAGDILAKKDPGNRHFDMLRGFKEALQTRKQFMIKEQKAATSK